VSPNRPTQPKTSPQLPPGSPPPPLPWPLLRDGLCQLRSRGPAAGVMLARKQVAPDEPAPFLIGGDAVAEHKRDAMAELTAKLQEKLSNSSFTPELKLVSVALALARDTTLDLRRAYKLNGISAGEAQIRVIQYAQRIIRENLAPDQLNNLGMWRNLNVTTLKRQAEHECQSRGACSLLALPGWPESDLSQDSAKRLAVLGPTPGRALSSVMHPPKARGYSSMVSDSLKGRIRILHDRVIKQFDPNTALHPERYFMEKRALCRLERCATPCASRGSYFPRVMDWNDARLALVLSMEGSPLTVKVEDIAPFYTRSDLRLNGSDVDSQFRCMQEQLARARVIHYDVQCKNLFAKFVPGREAALLTLGDLDASSVDGEPTRTTDHRRRHAPLGWNRCSLNQQVWAWKAAACFKTDAREASS
jgi:hypothetical protein